MKGLVLERRVGGAKAMADREQCRACGPILREGGRAGGDALRPTFLDIEAARSKEDAIVSEPAQ
ncbi:hypothetical protein [Bosea sp. CS1GBMeth4]|uniref:hypothetical protein n=1 Tax=Bosea sp. CS1GBMeth4 TaxID=1892849 RepID=UPI001648F650|nr:hypothetical protein [Bosea sp. CS1GBMeth4]